jgi:hypothetical protein
MGQYGNKKSVILRWFQKGQFTFVTSSYQKLEPKNSIFWGLVIFFLKTIYIASNIL